MKKNTYYKKIFILTFTALVIPVFSSAATKEDVSLKYPNIFSQKSCLVKYDTEVKSVIKLLDRNKADKKIREISEIRKEQDKALSNIFQKIENSIDDKEKKVAIGQHKKEIFILIDEKRRGIDGIQEETSIKDSDISNIVNETLIEIDLPVNVCPLQSNEKQIHSSNIVKLKKLAETKKEVYIAKTDIIQEDFSTKVTSVLTKFSSIVE